VAKVRELGARVVGLQLPEGLQIFACALADIVERFTGAATVVFGDVTFGACCVDDLGAAALGVDLLVHYGHSCLVPVDVTAAASGVRVLYVFVQIDFDVSHLVRVVRGHFPAGQHLVVAGTIQFGPAVHQVATQLRDGDPEEEEEKGGGVGEEKGAVVGSGGGETGAEGALVRRRAGRYVVTVPQATPLSPGEVLGCTSPRLGEGVDAIVFIADGRFHLESIMIHNPSIPAFRYNPYSKQLTREGYDHATMLATRKAAVDAAVRQTIRGASPAPASPAPASPAPASPSPAGSWGIILGTLGRQGNPAILERLRGAIRAAGAEDPFLLLLSEVTPAKLALMPSVAVWVQIACPRLSVDWSGSFPRPLLTPYEAFVALQATPWRADVYPMDFYARDSGPWTNYYRDPEERAREEAERAKRKAERAAARAARTQAKLASAPDRAATAAALPPPLIP
jgi:2-(3-amino-3-carboxypropyl)histidine synthase